MQQQRFLLSFVTALGLLGSVGCSGKSHKVDIDVLADGGVVIILPDDQYDYEDECVTVRHGHLVQVGVALEFPIYECQVDDTDGGAPPSGDDASVPPPSGDDASMPPTTGDDAGTPTSDDDASMPPSGDVDSGTPQGEPDAATPPGNDTDGGQPMGETDAGTPPSDNDASTPPVGDEDCGTPPVTEDDAGTPSETDSGAPQGETDAGTPPSQETDAGTPPVTGDDAGCGGHDNSDTPTNGDPQSCNRKITVVVHSGVTDTFYDDVLSCTFSIEGDAVNTRVVRSCDKETEMAETKVIGVVGKSGQVKVILSTPHKCGHYHAL